MPPDLTARVGEPSPVLPIPTMYALRYCGINGWTVGFTTSDRAFLVGLQPRYPLSQIVTIPGDDEPRVGVEEVVMLIDRFELDTRRHAAGETTSQFASRAELIDAIRRLAGEKP